MVPRELFLPISLVTGLVVYGLVAKWYVMPALRRRTRDAALVPLLLFHAFRFIGLAFLVPGVTAEPLDPRFSHHAAYGDLIAAALALLGVLALRRGWRAAVPIVWVFNVEGTLDLVNAVARGVLYVPAGHFGAAYFIPAVVVPALLVSHGMVFALLIGRQRVS